VISGVLANDMLKSWRKSCQQSLTPLSFIKFLAVTQDSQSLALGLTLIAAPWLSDRCFRDLF